MKAGNLICSYWVRYFSAITLIATLTTVSYMVIGHTLSVQEDDGRIINDAGRQRMLSQKVALYPRFHVEDLPDGAALEHKQALTDSAKLMIRSHCQLLDVSAESQTLQDLHFGSTQLSESVEVYVDAALSVAATTNYEQVQQNELSLFERDDVEGLLQNLNAAVTIYEAQSKARVTNLEKLETGLWMLTLFILFLESLSIFRPMERFIRSILSELESQRDEALPRARKARSLPI